MPAFAVVTESSGDGYALYNGVKLPDIDSVWVDKVSYPYAIITSFDAALVGYSGSSTVYLLDASGVAHYSNNGVCYKTPPYLSCSWFCSYDSDVCSYLSGMGLPITVGEWSGSSPSDIGSGSAQSVMGTAFWSNADILNTDNTVYLTASDPILLDGYNLMEWDGDATGLESFPISGLQYHRVADYFFTDSAIGVITDNYDHIVVWDNFETIYDMGWMVTSSGSNVVALSLNNEAIGVISPSSTEGTYFTGTHNGNYHQWCSLVAYRSVESPPDEGGGDDEPQPPFGWLIYNSCNYCYNYPLVY